MKSRVILVCLWVLCAFLGWGLTASYHQQQAIEAAQELKEKVDLLILHHNGEEWNQATGFVGAWLLYQLALEEWARLTREREEGIINVQLYQAKHALNRGVMRMKAEWKIVQKDLNEVEKYTKRLPPQVR